MANANSLINSQVVSGSPQVASQGFGDVMVLLSSADSSGYGSNEVRAYLTPAEIDADGPGGTGDLTAQAVINLKSAFDHVLRPVRVKAAQYNEINPINTEIALIQVVDDDWYGLCVTGANGDDKANILLIAAHVASLSKLYFAQSDEAAVKDKTAGNTLETLAGLSYNNVAYFYHADPTQRVDVGAMAFFLATNPDQRTTIVAWKTLTGVTKQTQLTGAELFTNILDENGNVYTEVRGIGAVQKGKAVSGEFIDVQLTKDWLAARVAEDMTQAESDFSNEGGKIPFDDSGIAVTDNVINSRLDRAVEAQHLDRRAPGTNGINDKGSPFLDPLLLVNVDPVDKSGRIIRRTYGGTITGAIQEADFLGSVATS